MKLLVTIPALNEENTIAQVIAGVPRKIPGVREVEVIVVNDGSTDRTAERAAEAGAIVVTLHNRPGLGKVFGTGLERAMRRGADIIVNIDGDGQFDPGDIAKLVHPIIEGEADFVTCSRFADPALRPEMPVVKYWGNKAVTSIINWVCGGTSFTDVSCGFRAFNREAAYRLTLFGRFTYTQECFIDLFSKGLRMTEVPLKVRGVREHGKSRIASSIFKYAYSSLPIILRAMRDIQPLKFFGGIAMLLFIPGLALGGFVTGWYVLKTKTAPYTSLIPISGVLITLAFLLGVLALLADMLGRHRKISEELLYLARRKVYAGKRLPRAVMASIEPARSVAHFFEQSWDMEHSSAENGEADEPARSNGSESPEQAEQSETTEAPVTLSVTTSVPKRQPRRMTLPAQSTPAAPRDFYDSQYHFEEDAARPDEKRIWHAMRHLEPLAESDFFDLGCGAGWATRLAKLDGKTRHIIGLDFSRTALQLARRHTPEILWIQGDGTALPLGDGSFDRLFCNGSLEHFPDIRRGLSEIARILRPGAKAVLIVPNFYVKTEQPMEFRTHYWGWKKLLEERGLKVERTGIDWGPAVFKNANLKRAVARMIGKVLSAVPFMQYQFIFVVRRS